MDLATMEGLASPTTGLVAMVVQRAFAPWTKGDVAGFPPAVAFEHYKEGVAVLYDPSKPPIRAEAPKKPAKPPRNAQAAAGDDDGDQKPKLPEITADWETMHYLKRITKAKEIDQNFKVPDGMKQADYADEVIRREVERRKTLLQSPAA